MQGTGKLSRHTKQEVLHRLVGSKLRVLKLNHSELGSNPVYKDLRQEAKTIDLQQILGDSSDITADQEIVLRKYLCESLNKWKVISHDNLARWGVTSCDTMQSKAEKSALKRKAAELQSEHSTKESRATQVCQHAARPMLRS